MKIFQNNINKNLKTIIFKEKAQINNNFYRKQPSYSKEWKDIAYYYNKNNLKNIPVNYTNINKIIHDYFYLYFNRSRKFLLPTRRLKWKVKSRRKTFAKIWLSNIEIKHTNAKAKITFYTSNREKHILKRKYFKIWKVLRRRFTRKFRIRYKRFLRKIFKRLKLSKRRRKNFSSLNTLIRRKKFLKYKLVFLRRLLQKKNQIIVNLWKKWIKSRLRKIFFRLIRRGYNYRLNQSKFHQLILLPKLSNILTRILGKKIEYNIINLKKFSLHTDLFTKLVGLNLKKIKRKKNRRNKKLSLPWNLSYVLSRTRLPEEDTARERAPIKRKPNKFEDINFISGNIKRIIGSSNVHQKIYNSINYKIVKGIRMELKGRLTKRYRADRAIYRSKFKGPLKNLYSSYQGLSSVLFRGNVNPNISYSSFVTKRRVGSFAVKGWISGQ